MGLGRLLVVYQPDVSCIVKSGSYSSPITLFARAYRDNVEHVVKTGTIDRVVVNMCEEQINSARARDVVEAAERNGVEVDLIPVEKLPYAEYLSKHLLETRIREIKFEKYPHLLGREYVTLKLMKRVADSEVPRKAGSLLLVATKTRVPTLDMAVYFAKKYKQPTCFASARDTGLSWTCIGPRNVADEIEYRAKKETGIYKRVTPQLVTGFILSYPESPLSYVDVLYDIIKNVKSIENWEPKGTKHEVFLPLILRDRISFLDYALRKTKLKRHYLQRVEGVEGKVYYVLDYNSNSPFHKVVLKEKVVSMAVYLPVPGSVAIRVPFTPSEVYIGSRQVAVDRFEESANGTFLVYLNGASKILLNEIKRNKKAVIVVAGGEG